MSDLFSLTGKVAVVTGGAGRLGPSIVEGLARQGARVYLADLQGAIAEAPFGMPKGEGITPIPLDITDEGSVASAISSIVKETGRLDVWVNNAYPRTTDWGDAIDKLSMESWRKNVDMHMNGYFLCSRLAAERMKTQGDGTIISLGSIYGVLGPDFSVYEGTKMTMPAAYSAIKGGIINMIRYFAAWYGPSGVRANCVSPGGIYNPEQPETFVEKYSARCPMRHMGDADDVVGAIMYLSSRAGKYVNGHNLIVDGGWSIT